MSWSPAFYHWWFTFTINKYTPGTAKPLEVANLNFRINHKINNSYQFKSESFQLDEEMLNKLRVAAEKEREQNEREYTKLFGSPIQYGSSVQVKVTTVFWQIISTLVVTCEVRQIHHNTSNTYLLVLRKLRFNGQMILSV